MWYHSIFHIFYWLVLALLGLIAIWFGVYTGAGAWFAAKRDHNKAMLKEVSQAEGKRNGNEPKTPH
jgi:hypothetical protein